MITIDPYEIDLAISQRITALHDAGALDTLGPEHFYGYTCEGVFGVCSGDIAGVRIDGSDPAGMLWLYLTDGRMVPAVPADGGPVPWRRIEH